MERSWRVRWRYSIPLIALVLVLVGAPIANWQESLRCKYFYESWQYENPELPGPCVAGFFSFPTDRADGTREIHWQSDWRASGPLVRGQETGEWSYRAPDGTLRGRFWKRDNLRNGPCEFWDESGTKRVTGRYRNGERNGLWKIQNVIGDGTSYIWYGL